MFSPAEYILRKAAPDEENVVWKLMLPRIRRVMGDSVIYTAAGAILTLIVWEVSDISLGGDLDLIYQGTVGMAVLLLAVACAWPAIRFRRDMRRRGMIDDLIMAGVSGYQCVDAFSAVFRAAALLWIVINLPYYVSYTLYALIEIGNRGIVASTQIILTSWLELALTALWMITIFWLLMVLRGAGIMIATVLTIVLVVISEEVPYGDYVTVVAVLVISEIVIRRSREWCIARYMDRLTRT